MVNLLSKVDKDIKPTGLSMTFWVPMAYKRHQRGAHDPKLGILAFKWIHVEVTEESYNIVSQRLLHKYDCTSQYSRLPNLLLKYPNRSHTANFPPLSTSNSKHVWKYNDTFHLYVVQTALRLTHGTDHMSPCPWLVRRLRKDVRCK